jgi:glutathione reductase (NADPH)
MAQYDYDLFIIGAGSGGVRAARVAAGHGAKVAIAEDYRVGGTCVIRGCIPKKLLSYAAHMHDEIADAAGFGWTIPEAKFDWPTLIANKDKEIDRLNGIYKTLLAKVTLIEARARLADAHTVEIDGRRITADHILIATGGTPERPKIPGIEHSITSNEAFHLPKLPKHVVVVGGGYIAVEFAGIFNGLGAKVTQLYRGEQILRGFDDDVRNFLAEEITKKGIDVRVKSNVAAIANTGAKAGPNTGGNLDLTLEDGTHLRADCVMFATGRRPMTADLGLEAVGVGLDEAGAVQVDANSRTAIPNIHAVGDCTDRINLTPVAIREGHAFADTVFGKKPWAMDYATVASAVFSQPPVGTVGLTEARARKSGKPLDIYKANFRPLKHTLSGSAERTLMKLVVDRESQVVLGAHMVGVDAPEIVQALAIAVKMRATKQQFDQAVAVHPTAAEEFVTMRTPEPEPVETSAQRLAR